jgi:hypothetical protein
MEQKESNNFVDRLQHYFDTTPREQVLKDWEETKEFDTVGIIMDMALRHINKKQKNDQARFHQENMMFFVVFFLMVLIFEIIHQAKKPDCVLEEIYPFLIFLHITLVYIFTFRSIWVRKRLLCHLGLHTWENIDKNPMPTPTKYTHYFVESLHECHYCKRQEFKGMGYIV